MVGLFLTFIGTSSAVSLKNLADVSAGLVLTVLFGLSGCHEPNSSYPAEDVQIDLFYPSLYSHYLLRWRLGMSYPPLKIGWPLTTVSFGAVYTICGAGVYV